MAQRVTDADLGEMEDYINEQLALEKISFDIRVGHRYGYTAIDLGRRGTGKVEKTIVIGLTKAEALLFLNGMTMMIDLTTAYKYK